MIFSKENKALMSFYGKLYRSHGGICRCNLLRRLPKPEGIFYVDDTHLYIKTDGYLFVYLKTVQLSWMGRKCEET